MIFYWLFCVDFNFLKRTVNLFITVQNCTSSSKDRMGRHNCKEYIYQEKETRLFININAMNKNVYV